MSPLIEFLKGRLGAVRQFLRRQREAEDDLDWDGGRRLAAFPYGGEILPLSGLVWVVEPWPDNSAGGLRDPAGRADAVAAPRAVGPRSRRIARGAPAGG